MKTMLKRKLYLTGLLGYSLLFIATKNPAQELLSSDTTIIQKEQKPAITLNKKAAACVKIYLKEYNSSLAAINERGESYFTIMDSVFTMYNLPVELKYLAVIESELKTSARSHVGAIGLWQLMPETAKYFGLKSKKNYDERHNVYKSTVAAARYMKSLYDEFGDWLLVIAAYNAGSGRVHYAIRQSGSHDFWRLQNFLPAETRNHVKKYIGAHYYFEGQGSLTTLTKAETQQYKKTVKDFIAKQSVENDDTNVIAVER
jgi:membrane-bound lytic murein transglycosylase D